MLDMPRWKVILILGVCVLGLLFSLPNVMARDGVMPGWWPSWLPSRTVNLGLDLQGGSHLLLEVDVDSAIRARAESMVQTARSDLRKEKIGYSRIAVLPDGLRLTLREDADAEKARKLLRGIENEINVTMTPDDKGVEARLSETALRRIADQTIDQSIEIVRRRVDETGTREPAIQRQGENRIIVQLPGVDNPEYIKEILGKTAQLAFHLVDTGQGGGATRMLPMEEDPAQSIPVMRRAIITGDMLTNAQPSFQQGTPVVSFNLNGVGARHFCDVTRKHTGEPFAIVLDGKVISAPRINEPICGGSAVITGQFSVQETSDLALLLRAGALPAPLRIMEERTVGPSLGSDSVAAGKKACLMALLFVTIFSCLAFGLFGVFASVGLLVNMVLIMAVMSALQATLTLPGIAGMVLAIGLAVDGNVLIFERIKEELRAGRSVMSAVDTGYSRARTTITDSNLTSLIAALILFSFGTGPIKGFAVTTCIGVATSYFCALMLTRLVVLSWLRWKKPKTIAA